MYKFRGKKLTNQGRDFLGGSFSQCNHYNSIKKKKDPFSEGRAAHSYLDSMRILGIINETS